jgi:hypothetical protein
MKSGGSGLMQLWMGEVSFTWSVSARSSPSTSCLRRHRSAGAGGLAPPSFPPRNMRRAPRYLYRLGTSRLSCRAIMPSERRSILATSSVVMGRRPVQRSSPLLLPPPDDEEGPAAPFLAGGSP